MDRATFAAPFWGLKSCPARRARFLAEMETAVPWASLYELIEECHMRHRADGRAKLPLDCMLRVYLMQLWFNSSDRETEQAVHFSTSMRRFAGIGRKQPCVPDEWSIKRFRRLLDTNGITAEILKMARADAR